MTTYRIRPALPEDAPACIELRGQTRENAISVQQLAARGITADTWAADVARGELAGWLACEETDGQETLRGHGFGAVATGEVVVLAVHPVAEGQGLGRQLLQRVVDVLRSRGHARPHLACAADPAVRSHGFYRHLGWQPTGRLADNGDEWLELPDR